MGKFTAININAVILMAVFLMLLFAFFLLTANTKNKLPNRLFSSFLILSIFDISSLFTDDYIEVGLHFEVFRMTSSLLTLPLLYLYVKAVCYSDFQLKPKHLLLGIPFLMANVVLIPRFYLGGTVESIYIHEQFKRMFEISFFYILRELQYVLYMVAIFKVLKKYKTIYIENHTNLSNSSYRWLLQMTGILFIAHCFLVLRFLPLYADNHQLLNWSNIGIGVCALIISSWFVLNALRRPELFNGVDAGMIALNQELEAKHVHFGGESLDTQESEEMTLQIDGYKCVRLFLFGRLLRFDDALLIQIIV